MKFIAILLLLSITSALHAAEAPLKVLCFGDSITEGKTPASLKNGERWIEVLETEHVDADEVRRHALPVKRIDPAHLAEEMACRFRVKLIFGERISTGEKPKPGFVHLDHQRILFAADRAIARGELRKIGVDLEAHGAAMARAAVSSVFGRGSIAQNLAQGGRTHWITRQDSSKNA